MWEPASPILTHVAVAIKWSPHILHGDIIAVIVGVYTMTPETANGRGAAPLVGDGEVPGLIYSPFTIQHPRGPQFKPPIR